MRSEFEADTMHPRDDGDTDMYLTRPCPVNILVGCFLGQVYTARLNSDTAVIKYAAMPDPPLLIKLYAIRDISGAAVYFTSGRDPITFRGLTYHPAPITRTSIKSDNAISTRSCQITVPLNPILGNYITQSYIMATISIWMLFQDYPESAVPLFHGHIPGSVNLNIDNKTVTALCVSPNASILENNVPRIRYMPYCQNTIYDNNCGVSFLPKRDVALHNKFKNELKITKRA